MKHLIKLHPVPVGNYDPRCFDLAELFLPRGSAEDLDTLAAEISRTIEDFIEDHPEAAEQ